MSAADVAGPSKMLAPPAGQSGRASPSGGRISPAAGRMSPSAGESAKMPGEVQAAARSPSNGKLIRILTVVAYLCSVSGAAFMLSLYYIFLWDPSAHRGESKPAAFQAPDDAHHHSASSTSVLPSSVSESPIMRAISNVTERIIDSATAIGKT